MRVAPILAALALAPLPVVAQTPAPGVTTTAPAPKPAEAAKKAEAAKAAEAKPEAKPADTKPAPRPEDKQLSGAYVYGAEVSSFQACGEKTVHWLDAEGKLAELLSANALTVAEQTAPYTPIYVTLTVRPGEAKGEFAKDYDGVLSLVSLDDLAWKLPADCTLPK